MADEHEFIAKLTDNARTSLRHAEAIARGQGSSHIGTEHLMIGILAQGSSVGAKVLADAGVTLHQAERFLNISPKGLVVGTEIRTLSDTAVLSLKMAHECAQQFRQEFLGTEHIIYSILKQNSARGTTLLRDIGADIEAILAEFELFFDEQQYQTQRGGAEAQSRQGSSTRTILDAFGTDITKKARTGAIDVVIGRDAEIERVITILSRRTKNNPLLIGEPGVGKTALVEGLARAIANEAVPEHLLSARIIQLDLASMVAGTKYRGEFEDRLKKVIQVAAADKGCILFIDEIHQLVGAGAAEGSMDAANILKPALARGEVTVIGATTLDEHRKYIEKDAALDRRFQSILVREPSMRDTVAILKGLRPYYEEHHAVTVSDAMIDDAVFLANRYITDRYMPDKAIDIIDEAASVARVSVRKRPHALRQLEKEAAELQERVERMVAEQDYERAALYKTRLSKVEERLEEARTAHAANHSTTLTEAHLAKALSSMTGIPLEKIEKDERRVLKHLEKHLAKRVIGQPEAVKAVARAIRRNRSGITEGRRPIGSFICMGPTGVGKTELARVLAEEVFGSADALIKIDMSEFSDRHSSSKLVGAPAGYVGYDDGGKLTDKVRKQPYSVILFDEIEKAHGDIYNLLLQLLEDGNLTDSKGRCVDFSNTVILLTSNLGAEEMTSDATIGFHVTEQDVQSDKQKNSEAAHEALRGFMRPELINRFDEVLVFNPLERKHVRVILANMIRQLSDRLARRGFGLKVLPAARRWIIDRGFDAKKGARPLRRVLEDSVEHGIAECLLDHKVEKGEQIVIGVKDGSLTIESEVEQ